MDSSGAGEQGFRGFARFRRKTNEGSKTSQNFSKPVEFGTLPLPTRTFKTIFEHVTIWRIHIWCRHFWKCILTYPKSGSKCLRSPIAMIHWQQLLLPWRFGNLTLPNQLLRPVLSTTQQDEFRTGLKSCETACLPTQNVSPNPYPHPWLGDQNRWAKHVWYPGSLATCHNHNQLLRPVLGRLQSDEFRNGLKICVHSFFPTQNQGQSAYIKSKMFCSPPKKPG